MLDFRSIVTFLGVFGAGVVTAGFFLSAPIQRPTVLQHAPDFSQQGTTENAGWVTVPPTIPFVEPLANPALDNPPPEQQASRTIAPEPSHTATTGSSADAPTQQAASAPAKSAPEVYEQPAAARQAEASCNYSRCKRQYRSFDEATCTYRSYDGRRQLCTK
jgi:BA14K-like protein